MNANGILFLWWLNKNKPPTMCQAVTVRRRLADVGLRPAGPGDGRLLRRLRRPQRLQPWRPATAATATGCGWGRHVERLAGLPNLDLDRKQPDREAL